MTVQDFADAVCIALAKRGVRVKVKYHHQGSIYLRASLKDRATSVRVSDHPPGKKWKGGFSLDRFYDPRNDSAQMAEMVAPEIHRFLKNG